MTTEKLWSFWLATWCSDVFIMLILVSWFEMNQSAVVLRFHNWFYDIIDVLFNVVTRDENICLLMIFPDCILHYLII